MAVIKWYTACQNICVLYIGDPKMPTEFGSIHYERQGLHFWVHNLKKKLKL